MEIDNLKEFSNISLKVAEQLIETCYLTFASILSMKMNQNKNAAWQNKWRNENFFKACK